MNDARIILDEQDAADLLQVIYNGKPHKVHILICLCGAVADLHKSPKAWNGWQVFPHPKCPACLRTPAVPSVELYPVRARKRFDGLLLEVSKQDAMQ